jgi:uncharacterized protein YjbI with pentapeptide repeats
MKSCIPLDTFSHSEKPLIQILEDHKKWLKGIGGERADLHGAVLSGADMSGVTLVGATLREAVMDRACLNRADLGGADLTNARLDRASLMGARFVACNMAMSSLVEAVSGEADFREANLNRATLNRAGLHRVIFRGADLRDASLRGANLVRADLRDADLTGADLSKSVLSGADLTGADFRGSRLTGANLVGVNLNRANLQSADLRDAKLGDALMTGSNLRRADLTGSDLDGASIEDAVISGWIVSRTSCARIVSSGGEVIGFDPSEFEKTFYQPEKVQELDVHIPLTVSSTYIAKFISECINMAIGSQVVELKGLEALSSRETKILFVVVDHDIHEKELKSKKTQLEKEINAYFLSHPVKKDHVDLGEMVSDAVNGSINFRSCRKILHSPSQINPKFFTDEIVEEYLALAQICDALHSIIFSVIASEHPDASPSS